MTVRSVLIVAAASGALVAQAAPVLAGTPGTYPALDTVAAGRIPMDAGAPDSILRPSPRPTLASASPGGRIAATYAERERSAPQLDTFRGGDGVSIYIGGGVLTAIVIVALIVILL